MEVKPTKSTTRKIVIISRHKINPEVKKILKNAFGKNIQIFRVNVDFKSEDDVKRVIDKYGKDAFYIVPSSFILTYWFKKQGVRVFHISMTRKTLTNPEILTKYYTRAIYEIENINVKLKPIYIAEDTGNKYGGKTITPSKMTKKYAAVIDENGKIVKLDSHKKFFKLSRKYTPLGYYVVLIDGKTLCKDRKRPHDCGALKEWIENDYCEIEE